MQTLADVSAGQSVVVDEVVGDDSTSMRLMEMGVLDGEVIRVVGKAPFGDPIEVCVRSYRLSLRMVEAERIRVKAISNSSQASDA